MEIIDVRICTTLSMSELMSQTTMGLCEQEELGLMMSTVLSRLLIVRIYTTLSIWIIRIIVSDVSDSRTSLTAFSINNTPKKNGRSSRRRYLLRWKLMGHSGISFLLRWIHFISMILSPISSMIHSRKKKSKQMDICGEMSQYELIYLMGWRSWRIQNSIYFNDWVKVVNGTLILKY